MVVFAVLIGVHLRSYGSLARLSEGEFAPVSLRCLRQAVLCLTVCSDLHWA